MRTGDGRRMLHPELTAGERRRLFFEGIELFNTGRYFDCHEAFETIWRSTTPEPRDLFQGLIQVAVGLHHFHVRGRPEVARRVIAKGRGRLGPFLPGALGLDLAGLDGEIERWLGWLTDGEGEPPRGPRLGVVEEEAVR